MVSRQSAGTAELPLSQGEQTLRSLWAATLCCDIDGIGRHDSFIRLGGDSIKAMRLVSLARQAGVPLTVENVLKYPILSEQTRISEDGSCASQETGPAMFSPEVPRFSLLQNDSDTRHEIIQAAANQCDVPIDQVEDIYACTPMQEGLFSLTVRTPGAYTAQHIYRLPAHVDDGQFKAAWDTVLEANPILRTRIVQSTSQGQLYQVVLRNHGIQWKWHDHFQQYLEEDKAKIIRPGLPLIRLAIAHSDSFERYCVITFHHSIYDRYSLSLVLRQVAAAYCGNQIESSLFTPFVKYVSQLSVEADKFWAAQLSDFEGPIFPSLPSSDYTPSPTKSQTLSIPLSFQESGDFTLSTKVRLAWAITISHYTGSEDVVFGITVSGRAAPVPGVENMTGPTIATIPQRVRSIQAPVSVHDALSKLQDTSSISISFEQIGLRRISGLNGGASLACKFQSLLVIQARQDDESSEDISNLFLAENPCHSYETPGFSTYGLTLCCEQRDAKSLDVCAIFDEEILSRPQARRTLDHFASVLQHINRNTSGSIGDIPSISPHDLVRLQEWNASLPSPVGCCVHDLIYEQQTKGANNPAVCSWDGTLTYRELNHLSSRLASYLVCYNGISPKVFVPLCFEKSKWAIVALVAVMKAGGAFTLLEPSYPQSRLQEVCEQVGASVVLSSEQNATRTRSIAGVEVVVVAENSKDIWGNNHNLSKITRGPVTSSDPLYAVFTSGSTGKPKGVVITHGSFASSTQARPGAARFSSHSRVLHFASYAFDSSVLEAVGTLVAGGCLCIASEETRRDDICNAINELRCNHLLLTPTVARLIKPSTIPSVMNMSLGGEPVRQSDIETWKEHLNLTIEYGPAECSVSSTFQQVASANDANLIGKSSGGVCWIVNPFDHDRLMPIGAIGELLIEGPIVGDGYLNDPERTRTSFIGSPCWLPAVRQNEETTRMYKTGDLVRYAGEDGRLRYIGRKDAQVKVHGQRFELGEVEYHTRRAFNEECNGADVEDLVVELICPASSTDGGKPTPTLGVFVRLRNRQMFVTESNGAVRDDSSFESPSFTFIQMAHNVQSKLLQRLPSYMVPAAIVPMKALPVSLTGKVDRKGLRELCSQVCREELMASLSASTGKRRPPATEVERHLYNLTKEVIRRHDFGLDDHFFRLGGDSIVAMQLVGKAREVGVCLQVADIFKFPVLKDLAQIMEVRGKEHTNKGNPRSLHSLDNRIEPFALLENDHILNSAIESAHLSYGMPYDSIEDIYPCTSLQEGLFALTLKHSSQGNVGDLFTIQQVFELRQDVDIERLKFSWETLVKTNTILRTRIIPTAEQCLQVVLHPSSFLIPWEDLEDSDLDAYLARDSKKHIQFGDALVRCAMVRNQGPSSHNRFILTMHHAIYDAWTLPLLLRQVEAIYNDQKPVPTTPFNQFINYLQGLDVKVSENFWRSSFEDLQAAPFPELPSSGGVPKPTAYLRQSINFGRLETIDVTPSTLARFAWALTLSEYTNTPDVLYGVTVSGRDVPLSGVENIAGPTIATFPLRVQLQKDNTVEEALLEIQGYITQSIPHQHLGLQKISSLSSEAASACQFGSLLIVQPASQNVLSSELFLGDHQPQIRDSESTFDNSALTVICELDSEAQVFNLEAFYDPKIVPEGQMAWVMEQFSFYLQQLRHRSSSKIMDILGANPRHLKQLEFWNSPIPPAVNSCVHDLIEAHSISRPSAMAVSAWDGEFTYKELEDLSSHLAFRITTQYDIRPGIFVPLCFEKSKWTQVALLAVMRAGGAFVLLDPSQPLERLKGICSQLETRVILASVQNTPFMKNIGLPVMTVSDSDTVCSRECESHKLPNSVCPSDPLYAIFTSGSTGTPKGIIIEHAALATNAFQYGRLRLYDGQSRVLQFASYTFDACFAEILYTLICGGCVCVPAGSEQMNITQTISKYNVNLASLTPSITRSIEPNEMPPSLRTILLGGEAVQSIDLDMWAEKVRLVNGYGPSECAVDCTINAEIHRDSNPKNIGRSNGASCWVVNPDDAETLMPIGVVGELLVEGGIVGRGYLNNPDKTAASFIKPPEWLSRIRGGKVGRLYLTGDLVQYNPSGDGSILYIGRKDTQVKLRGQRLELGEVEYHLRECFSSARDVAAELIKPADEGAQSVLAAFLYFGNMKSSDGSLFAKVADFQTRVLEAQKSLSSRLPRYMVPEIYLPLSMRPLSSAGKLDRRTLKEKASALPRAKLQSYGTPERQKRPPATTKEKLMQNFVGNVLRLSPNDVGMNDSFVHLGGDSISALRLVGHGRKNGVSFTVADVFQYTQLGDLAKILKDISGGDKLIEVEPFSQVTTDEKLRSSIVENAATECGVDRNQIDDIYPCTPMQEALFALSMKQPGAYTAKFSLCLREGINLEQFKQAWFSVLWANPILRTRIISDPRCGSLQVVIYGSEGCGSKSSSSPYDALPIAFGSPLIRFALTEDPQDSHRYRFYIVMHHALYDDWSLRSIFEQLEAAYMSQKLEPRPFSPFIKYMSTVESTDAAKFWNEELSNIESPVFPSVPSDGYTSNSTESLQHQIHPFRLSPETNVTSSVVLKAAWGLTLSQFTGSDDILFGTVVNGRSAPLAGVEQITGPTITTVPMRVRFQHDREVQSFLEDLQQRITRAITFEQTGLQKIREFTSGAGCDFQNLLVIQSLDSEQRDVSPSEHLFTIDGAKDVDDLTAFGTYPLTLLCHQSNDKLEFEAVYDKALLSTTQMERILHQLEHNIHELNMTPTDNQRLLSEIDPTNFLDQQRLQSWNSVVPKPASHCVHDLIAERILEQPLAEAVCSWDGSITYAQLDELSWSLASEMTSRGVNPGDIVPIYFEKSKWTPVLVMAVMRTGSAFLLLDTGHPKERLSEICHSINPKVIVCAENDAAIVRGFAPQVMSVNVTQELPLKIKPRQKSIISRSNITSEGLLYVVFTSGSTGKPKGVMIQHQAFCSMAIPFIHASGMNSNTRMLAFASYGWDVGIHDILMPLIAGGCICVPSETDRTNDLAKCINENKANYIAVTPSVLRTIRPEDCSTSLTLEVGGESLSKADFLPWVRHGVRFLQAYGPSECSVTSTCVSMSEESDPSNIGKAMASCLWVVNPSDHERLVPIGTPGELLVEGPIVAFGYYNRPEESSIVFIDTPPKWLAKYRGEGSSGSRFYKTGDLVTYNPDGSIRFIGRKDNQIKIRGQRIDPGEAEYQIQKYFPESITTVVEVVKPSWNDTHMLLVAFICPHSSAIEASNAAAEDKGSNPVLSDSSGNFREEVGAVKRRLYAAVPRYMVPDAFVPINYIPRSNAGKANRRLLRDLAGGLQRHELGMVSVAATNGLTMQAPVSEAQKLLQGLFADIFTIPIENISVSDDFFQLGGDSIVAMRLVANARQKGVSLTVADILGHPILSELAETIDMTKKIGPSNDNREPIAPFSLLDSGVSSKSVTLGLATEQCDVPENDIEDIYPCTPLQEGLMVLSLGKPGAYVAHHRFKLPEDTDLDLLRFAWKATVDANPILRTRIIQAETSLQVVIRDQFQWEWIHSDSGVNCVTSWETQFGRPLIQFTAVISKTKDQPHLLYITIHHALYDGWTMSSILGQVQDAYRGESLRLHPFNSFVQYLLGVNCQSMHDYWIRELQGLDATPFPPLSSSKHISSPTKFLEHTATMEPKVGITSTTTIRLAWSIILSQYTSSSDVVFGVTLSGRDTPIAGIDTTTGPTIATVPFRVRLTKGLTVHEMLQAVQAQSMGMIPFQHSGLKNISKLGQDAESACAFQNLLVIQPPETEESTSQLLLVDDDIDADVDGVFDTYAIVLKCQLSRGNQMKIRMNFDSDVVPEMLAERLLSHFSHILAELQAKTKSPLENIDAVSPSDISQLQDWNNSAQAARIEDCVYHLFQKHCIQHPNDPAICAWDGELTYGELDNATTQFAYRLRELGVGPEIFVPICLPKSRWAIVAILAILKAGGAFVLIDPTIPLQRRQKICSEVKAEFVISSQQQIQDCSYLATTVVSVSNEETDWQKSIGNPDALFISSSASDSSLYAAFTSGSTGQPKGVVIDNAAFCSLAHSYLPKVCLNRQSRVLQFVSYAFDPSITDILATLLAGGCLCIPSDNERTNDLPEAVKRLKANWVNLTPSILRAWSPEDFPTLETVLSGGEPLSSQEIETWSEKVRLFNGYGPAECCVKSTFQPVVNKMSDPLNIGYPLASECWVVDPSDYRRLMPIGTVGELVIGGPKVGRGYINNPEATSKAFLSADSLPWRQNFQNYNSHDRFYLTGDLMQFAADGTLRFAGRKDTQVKIRGQRIELSDIEQNIRQCFPLSNQVAVEIVTNQGADQSQAALVAFIALEHASCVSVGCRKTAEDLFTVPCKELKQYLVKVEEDLQKLLPSYMIPSRYFILPKFPFTTSGKTDRRKLREEAASLSVDQVKLYAADDEPKRLPSTPEEEIVCQACAQILQLKPRSIGMNDSFFHLGGDSISALKFTSLSRKKGLIFQVADVFSYPRLSELAAVSNRSDGAELDGTVDDTCQKVTAHSYLGFNCREDLIADAVRSSALDADSVQEVLPATNGQIMRLYEDNHHFIFRMEGPLNHMKLEGAIRSLIQRHDILRVVFQPYTKTVRQVILRNAGEIPVIFRECNQDLAGYVEHLCLSDDTSVPTFNIPVTRFTIVKGAPNRHDLILRLSHAQYDGFSRGTLSKELKALYEGQQLPESVPYGAHIQRWLRHKHDPKALTFWRDYLRGSRMSTFDKIPQNGTENSSDEPQLVVKTRDVGLVHPPEGVTLATVVNAAWSIALALLTRQNDIVFGFATTGRNSQSLDNTNVMGLCLNRIPIRAQLGSASLTVLDLLRDLQQIYREGMKYELVEISDILGVPPPLPGTELFGSVLIFQNASDNAPFTVGGATCTWDHHGNFPQRDYVVVEAAPSQSSLGISIATPNTILSPDTVEIVLETMEDIIPVLVKSLGRTVSDVFFNADKAKGVNGVH